jgi:hypothetical protein
MNAFKHLPSDLVSHVLSFSPTYYKENYKNRKGKFYKQIEKSRKTPISNVYAPVKRRCIRERFTHHQTYFYERLLGGKYILYVEDNASDLYSDDEGNELDLEWLYHTSFCRTHEHPHRGYGIQNEHLIDSTIHYNDYNV